MSSAREGGRWGGGGVEGGGGGLRGDGVGIEDLWKHEKAAGSDLRFFVITSNFGVLIYKFHFLNWTLVKYSD